MSPPSAARPRASFGGRLRASFGGRLRVLGTALALPLRAAPAASAGVLALTVVTGSMTAVGASLTKRLVDALVAGPGARPGELIALAGAAGASVGLSMLGYTLAHYLDALVHRRTALAVDRALLAKVTSLAGLRHFEDPQFQTRLRLAERAAAEAPFQFTQLAESVLRTAVTVATLAGVVFAVSPALAGVLLAVGLVGFGAQLVRSRADLRLMEAAVVSDRWRDFYRALLLDVRAAKEIRLFGLGPLLLGRMLSARRAADRDEIAVERRSAWTQGSLSLATALIAGAGTALVARGVRDGRFGLGDVTLFIAAVAGVQGASAQLLLMAGMTGRTLSMFQHYLDLLDTAPPPARPLAAPAPLRRGLELRDVWFRYGPDAPWVLRGVNLVLPRGAALGLVGLNGAGKSTLVKLLCGFYEPERGQILWDGADVRTLDPAALRRRLGVTFQDFMTYDLTARENVGLGDVDHVDDLERVVAAARQAAVDDRLAALPRGYDTLLSRVMPDEEDPGGQGASLSGGEWQRVAIARTLMRRDVDLVILDEPSAGLDAAAEAFVHQAFRAHRRGRTQLLISHRLSALRGADSIVVLSEGRVVEQGDHDALMSAGGEYARLFALQASGYQDARLAASAGAA